MDRLFKHALTAVLGLIISSGACALPLSVVSYDTINGHTGSYPYWDEIYSGSGNTGQDGAHLSGGTGDLTDGVIASQNWHAVEPPSGNGPYVGWIFLNPEITFHFAAGTLIDSLTLYLDDANNAGGVNPPNSVDVGASPGSTNNYAISDPADGSPIQVTLSGLGLSDSVFVRLNQTHGEWTFLSEVTFDGTPFSSVPTPLPIWLLIAGVGLYAVRQKASVSIS